MQETKPTFDIGTHTALLESVDITKTAVRWRFGNGHSVIEVKTGNSFGHKTQCGNLAAAVCHRKDGTKVDPRSAVGKPFQIKVERAGTSRLVTIEGRVQFRL